MAESGTPGPRPDPTRRRGCVQKPCPETRSSRFLAVAISRFACVELCFGSLSKLEGSTAFALEATTSCASLPNNEAIQNCISDTP